MLNAKLLLLSAVLLSGTEAVKIVLRDRAPYGARVSQHNHEIDIPLAAVTEPNVLEDFGLPPTTNFVHTAWAAHTGPLDHILTHIKIAAEDDGFDVDKETITVYINSAEGGELHPMSTPVPGGSSAGAGGSAAANAASAVREAIAASQGRSHAPLTPAPGLAGAYHPLLQNCPPPAPPFPPPFPRLLRRHHRSTNTHSPSQAGTHRAKHLSDTLSIPSPTLPARSVPTGGLGGSTPDLATLLNIIANAGGQFGSTCMGGLPSTQGSLFGPSMGKGAAFSSKGSLGFPSRSSTRKEAVKGKEAKPKEKTRHYAFWERVKGEKADNTAPSDCAHSPPHSRHHPTPSISSCVSCSCLCTVELNVPEGSTVKKVKDVVVAIINKLRHPRKPIGRERVSLTTTKGSELANGDDEAEAPPQHGNTKYYYEILPPKSRFTALPPDDAATTPSPVSSPPPLVCDTCPSVHMCLSLHV